MKTVTATPYEKNTDQVLRIFETREYQRKVNSRRRRDSLRNARNALIRNLVLMGIGFLLGVLLV